MYKIIIGMFFIAFNFPVKIEYVIIGLIPDFVGYLLIRRGLGELADEENHFKEAYMGTTVAIVYSAVMYGLDLFGITGLIVYDSLVGALTGILIFVVTLLSWIMYELQVVKCARGYC